MGCFSSTCCVSGLPIGAGDPVRWFLLTQNPYCHGGFVCYMHGRWVPRTWPIKARYNDYGSIEDWETGPLLDVVMQGLQADLVEKGVGDNSCHDVAARKNMSFEQLLEAVWEGRVSIIREVGGHSEPTPIPDWVPTLASVEAALSTVELPENGRYLVDDSGDGIRVRWDGLRADFGKDAHWLGLASAALSQFATVITAGSGNYSNSAELRCFVAPGKTEHGHPRNSGRRESETPLLIQQAMIREDVWQALVGLSGETGAFREQAKAFLLARAKVKKEDRWMMRQGDSFVAHFLAKDPVPYLQGLNSHLELLDPVPEGFADLAAEFAALHHVLASVRHVWRPSDTAGSQCPEFEENEPFLRALADLAKSLIRHEEEEE